jgi:hypothetical protein
VSEEADAEPILTQHVAGRLARGVNLMGGTMVLTSRRVVFVPLISRSALKASSRAAGLSQHLHHWHAHPQKLLNTAIMPLTKLIEIPLDRIEAITATRRCAMSISWMDTKPRTMEFAISATRFSPIWNPENVVSRDRLLAAIEAARKDAATG